MLINISFRDSLFFATFIFMEEEIGRSRCENCIVRKFNSLKAMSKEELKAVSDSKVSRKIKKGEIIFDEGEKLAGVYCVRDGVSKLSKLSENGKDQIVKLASKGQVLGQRSVVAEESANLSATAVNDMEICFIPREAITDTLHKNPEFSYEVLQTMAHDLREADDVIVNMSQKSVKQRIAQALLYLRENFGEDGEGYLLLVLSREDIASVVGTATESCIRMLSELRKEGLIKTSGKRLSITDARKLKSLADGF
ncbi:transcriptional regulatory protein [Robiginitalea biformata HTCC2501]|uniref:Transcriptional regulatory protein n=2 Tax=Flavobacteriaceae TaxID=49546 RepID=A4CGJ8_ROBBH|nr:transcriptional regulatory protein [Robiginitalea biformata HTCC2501]